jgi:hypothetical protein
MTVETSTSSSNGGAQNDPVFWQNRRSIDRCKQHDGRYYY